MPAKKYSGKKAGKLCLMGEIVFENHSFLEYTEPLNPREHIDSAFLYKGSLFFKTGSTLKCCKAISHFLDLTISRFKF